MSGPYGEESSVSPRLASLTEMPMALLMWLARQATHGHSVLGDGDTPLVYTPEEMRGLCLLNETPPEE